jgi:hypothetical protein
MDEPVELNRVIFGLPVRRFNFEAAVTVNESLPKVTEFALRLIRLCNGVSADELSGYFGFSANETRTAVEAMATQQLVRVDDDGLIRLTSYAEDKFTNSSDELPRFFSVKDERYSVDFELAAMYPLAVAKRLPEAPSGCVELDVDAKIVSDGVRLAESAFQRHFSRVIQLSARPKDKVGVYKVTSVEAKRSYMLPILGRIQFDDTREIARTVEYPDGTPEDFRVRLDEAISNRIKGSLESDAQALEEFVTRFPDPVTRKFIKNGGFDFAVYVGAVLRHRSTRYPSDTVPVVGNFYLPENARLVAGWVRSTFPTAEDDDERNGNTDDTGETPPQMGWLAPDVPLWGRISEVGDLVSEVEKALPKYKTLPSRQRPGFHVFFPSERGELRNLANSARIAFAREKTPSLHGVCSRVVGGRLELILCPGKFAGVLFHHNMPGQAALLAPAGFLTRDVQFLHSATVAFRDAVRGRLYLGPVSMRRATEEADSESAVGQFIESL